MGIRHQYTQRNDDTAAFLGASIYSFVIKIIPICPLFQLVDRWNGLQEQSHEIHITVDQFAHVVAKNEFTTYVNEQKV